MIIADWLTKRSLVNTRCGATSWPSLLFGSGQNSYAKQAYSRRLFLFFWGAAASECVHTAHIHTLFSLAVRVQYARNVLQLTDSAVRTLSKQLPQGLYIQIYTNVCLCSIFGSRGMPAGYPLQIKPNSIEINSIFLAIFSSALVLQCLSHIAFAFWLKFLTAAWGYTVITAIQKKRKRK